MQLLEHVKVLTRIHPCSSAISSYSAPVLRIGADHKTLEIKSESDSIDRQFLFDGCYDAATTDYKGFLIKANYLGIAKHITNGFNVALLTTGIGEVEKEQPRQQLLEQSIDHIQQTINAASNDYSFTAWGGVFGLSDSSCIDVSTYERLSMEQVDEIIHDMTSLPSLESIEAIKGSLRQGYALSCAILLCIKCQPHDATLPATFSNILLADLGTIPMMEFSKGSASTTLEKSFSNLKSISLMLEQPYLSACLPFDQLFLTKFLEPFLGNSAYTWLLADVINSTNPKNLMPSLQLIESLRRVKNYPRINYEALEAKQLATVLVENERLEKKVLEKKGRVKCLKADLATKMQENQLLHQQCSKTESCSSLTKSRLEYELACAEVRKVDLEDRLRVVQVDLMAFELEVKISKFELQISKLSIGEVQHTNQQLLATFMQTEQNSEKNLNSLKANLQKAEDSLSKVQQEKESILVECKELGAKCQKLGVDLDKAEEAKHEVEQKLLKLKTRDAEELNQVHLEYNQKVDKLRHELDIARANETSLQRKLEESFMRTNLAEKTISELELQLTRMREEKVTLLAKLEVYTTVKEEMLSNHPRESSIVQKVMSSIEAERQKDRSEMEKFLQELRKVNTNITSSKSINHHPTRASDEQNESIKPNAQEKSLPDNLTPIEVQSSKQSGNLSKRKALAGLIPPKKTKQQTANATNPLSESGKLPVRKAKHKKNKDDKREKEAEVEEGEEEEVYIEDESVNSEAEEIPIDKSFAERKKGKKRELTKKPDSLPNLLKVQQQHPLSKGKRQGESITEKGVEIAEEEIPGTPDAKSMVSVKGTLGKIEGKLQIAETDRTKSSNVALVGNGNGPKTVGGIWKPSAFIPGIKPIASENNPLFALNLQGQPRQPNNPHGLGGIAGGTGKKIKLPERPGATVAGNTAPIVSNGMARRRNGSADGNSGILLKK